MCTRLRLAVTRPCPPNAVLAWGEPGTDAPEEAVVVISDPSITADGLQYHVQTLQGTPPATAGPCVLFIDPLGRPLSPVSPEYAAGTCAGTAAGCSARGLRGHGSGYSQTER